MIRFLPPCVETTVHYLDDMGTGAALLLNNRDEIVGFQIEGWRNRKAAEKFDQIKRERDGFRNSWNGVMVENDSLRERNEKLREQNERLREALKALL